MYKRILVPLDGSHFSEEVIPYAAGLAAVHGTELVLLRVLDKEADHDEAADYIERLAAVHKARGLCLLKMDDVAHTIVEQARGEPATLLAMTSHGRSGLMEIMLGSVTQRVVRDARGPVLVYHPTGASRSDHAPIRLRRVVLPLQGNSPHEAMANQAAQFARWVDAELEVVSAVQTDGAGGVSEEFGSEITMLESSYVRSKAAELARHHGVRVNWEVLHGDPTTAINDHVADRRDAILAMVTRCRGALEAAVLGSVTLNCLRKAGVPILMRLP